MDKKREAASASFLRRTPHGLPDEVTSLALFLFPDAAAFITGADIPLEGGFVNLRG